MTEKAYKILATQEGISNREAKVLIDKGLVYNKGRKLKIAREEISASSKLQLKIPTIPKPRILHEDDDLLALEKPAFLEMRELEKLYPDLIPIHRLDRETSGILLMGKNEAFQKRCIAEFKAKRVYKEYIAIVNGIISEPLTIDKAILTHKGTKAHSVISHKGESALTEIDPLETHAKRTKLKVIIHTGKTHQIRVHLKSIGHPIIGDEAYGGIEAERIYLHAKTIRLLDYDITSEEPDTFLNLERIK